MRTTTLSITRCRESAGNACDKQVAARPVRTALAAAVYALVLTGTLAAQADEADEAGEDESSSVSPPNRSSRIDVRGYIPVERGRASTALPALVQDNIVYLNRCAAGCTITPGFENSLTNRSSIIDSTAQISPFQWGDDVWNEVVHCVRETYAAFDLTIVTEDPSPMPHWEAIIAGDPSEAGMAPNVGGVAPFDAAECGVITNAITYSFANMTGGDVPTMCWVAAQEIAHAFGLDHEFLCSDPMTYLTDCGAEKAFQDEDVRCGEFEPRDCRCGDVTQNSVTAIMEVFGPRNPTPPRVLIESPVLGDRVGPGFLVKAIVEEDVALGSVELWVNQKKIREVKSPQPGPIKFFAPLTLSEGDLVLEVRAADTYGAKSLAQVLVSMTAQCSRANACEGDNACVQGRCVPGPGAPGGLGASCQDDSECSGVCAGGKESEESVCAEACLTTTAECPGGFTCERGKALTAVCWPAAGGGCQTPLSGGSHTPSVLFGFALLCLVGRRLRRAALR